MKTEYNGYSIRVSEESDEDGEYKFTVCDSEGEIFEEGFDTNPNDALEIAKDFIDRSINKKQ